MNLNPMQILVEFIKIKLIISWIQMFVIEELIRNKK